MRHKNNRLNVASLYPSLYSEDPNDIGVFYAFFKEGIIRLKVVDGINTFHWRPYPPYPWQVGMPLNGMWKKILNEKHFTRINHEST
jgi:hypothetical protein